VLHEPVDIELAGSGENVHAFAWTSDSSLRSAVRSDFSLMLKEEARQEVLDDTVRLLLAARNPRLLFDFDRLTDLFARELVPTQIALDDTNPTFFSPARLDVLGPK
jgi:hypothetical protein